MAAAHAFVSSLDAPRLDDDDRHHLERVLRMRPGESLTVSDGAGRWRECRFGAELEPVGGIEVIEQPHPPVTIAFALTKGGRPDWTVQKLTELAVDVIIPFVAARSVTRWDGDRAERSVARLRRVAREAAMQSRRVWLPEVADLSTFAVASALPGAVLADRGGAPPSSAGALVLVGPEGGWDDDERAVAIPRVSLGTGVLRAETAAVAAGVLGTAMRAGLVCPGGHGTWHP